jgi:predicted nucleotidyltransferase component of viral defense system
LKDSIYFQQAKLLVPILPEVRKESVFALKGGTAINYFYRDLPRLSVDIDLTYLPIKTRDESILEISSSIANMMKGVRYTMPNIRIIPRKNKAIGLIIGFMAAQKNITVKIEPNVVLRGSVFPPEKVSLSPYAIELFGSKVRLQRLSFPDLYGGKICAALDRQHPRDLFDVKLLMENEGLTDDVRKAFIVYLISHPRPMAELLDPKFQNIDHIFNNEFRGMTRNPVKLQDLLDVREKLIKQIHLDLTNDERHFILSVKERRPDWGLLGIHGIEGLPAVQWKLQNLMRMDQKKHVEAFYKLKQCLNI